MRKQNRNAIALLQLALVLLVLFASYASGHAEPMVFAGGMLAATPPLAMQPVNPWVDALRPGTFRGIDGKEHTVSLGDLEKMAANTNEQVKSWRPPLVTGHPKMDSPRYGSIVGARVNNGILQLAAADLSPSFVDSVRRGEYTDRSLSFYYPDLTIRHLGFLGAHKPAVTGLAPVSFGEGEFAEIDKGKDSSTILFAEGPADLSEIAASHDSLAYRVGRRFENVRDLLRKLRDYIIDKDGLEKADSLMPAYMVDGVELGDVKPVSYAAPDTVPPAAPATVDNNAGNGESELGRQLAAEREARTRAETDLKTLRAEKRSAEFASMFSNAVKAGKMTPAMRQPLEALFRAADGSSGLIQFGEGEPKDTLKAFGALVDSMPMMVSLSSPVETLQGGSMDAGAIAGMISKYCEENGCGTSQAYIALNQQGAFK